MSAARSRVRARNSIKSAALIEPVYQRPGIEPAQWRDPTDNEALERGADGKRHQRTIRGYRAIDPLDRLPCELAHRKAAFKLRMDWECGSGGRTGGGSLERVDGSSHDRDNTSAQLEARRRYEAAVRAIGQRACVFVMPVVLSGWTVADLVVQHGGNAMAMQGRVMAGLDRLVEHYFPPKEVQFVPPPAPFLVDPSVTDLDQERLGRWRK